MSSDDHPSFLVVIIDAKGSAWKNQEKLASDLKVRKDDFVKSLLIFLNAYILLHRRNRLLIISRNSSTSKFIFPASESIQGSPDFIPTPDIISKSIIESFFNDSESSSSTGSQLPDVPGKASIAQALSKALCGEYLRSVATLAFVFLTSYLSQR